MNLIRRIYHPELYQGTSRRSGHFEGWYFKVVADEGSMALIPGISHPRDGEPHAFVQLIRSGGSTSYFGYPASEFQASSRRFEVEIGGNRFSRSGISLDLAGEDGHIIGELAFGEWTGWPVTALSPGAMGPYRFAPFMECYHGVLSMSHRVDGIIETGEGRMVLHDARGYAEKDWGRSFPKAWVWAQCNSFLDPGVSVMLSVARVPWLRSAFTGVIAGVLLDGRLLRFATHTGARLEYVDVCEGSAEVIVADDAHRLTVKLAGARPGVLRSPVAGGMEGTVYETLDGSMHVRLEALAGGGSTSLLDMHGCHAGLEVMASSSALQADERL